METMTPPQNPKPAVSDESDGLQDHFFDQQFKPKGAMAFFVLIVILGAIIWYSIYFLMLKRV